jgi:hypothetical protein
MNNVKEKKKLNKVDVMIIILLMLCLAGVVLRVFVTASKPEEYTNPDEEVKEYVISYISKDHFSTTKDYLKEGTSFRFHETNNPFGVTLGAPIPTNATKGYYNELGEYVSVTNDAENKLSDNPFAQYIAAKYDIEGEMIVKGKYSKENVFIIEGSEKENITLNKPILLRSDEMVISIVITDIKPAE